MMDSAETFYSSFKFDGNTEFINNLMKNLDALEAKLSPGVSNAINRVEKSMSALSAYTSGYRKPDLRSLEQIEREAKVASDRFDALGGSANHALNGIASDAGKAARKMETMDERTAKLGDSWGKMRNMGLAVGAALSAAGYGMWYALDKSTEMVDGLDESAQAAGTSATALAQLQYAAKKGGSSAEELGVALKTVSVNAAAGDKAFESLGVNVRDSNGNLKKSDALFLEVGNKLQGMGDRTQAAAIATNLFGRSGAQMLSVFGSAPGTIEATMKEAEKLGLVFSEADIKAASDFQDSIQRVGVAFQLASAKLLSGIGPKVTQFMDNLTAKLAAFSDSEAGKKLAEGMRKFADAAMRAFDAIIKIAPQFVEIGTKIVDIGTKIGEVVTPISDLVSNLLEIPGATDLIADGLMIAFGMMAVSRVLKFATALKEVAAGMKLVRMEQALEGMGGASAGGGAKGVGKKLVGSWGFWGAIALTAYEAASYLDESGKKDKAEKDLKHAQAGYAKSMKKMESDLALAKESGDSKEVERIMRKMQNSESIAIKSNWIDASSAKWISSDAKGSVNKTYYDNRITQNNTIGADISKIGDLIGKNLEKLVRSQINIDIVSSRVVRMGGV